MPPSLGSDSVYRMLVPVYVVLHWPFVQRQDSGLWIRQWWFESTRANWHRLTLEPPPGAGQPGGVQYAGRARPGAASDSPGPTSGLAFRADHEANHQRPLRTTVKQRTILIPAYDFKPLLGGVANYGHELAVQFSRRARVHVVCPKLPGMEEFDRDLPYTVTRIRTPQSGVLSFPLFASTLRRLIRRHPPDAIFCPMWFPDGAAARWSLGGAPIPYFVAAHGTEVFDNFKGMKNGLRTVLLRRLRLKGKVFQQAEKVFPVSRYTRKAVLEEASGEEDRIITVNNGVNCEMFRRAALNATSQAKYKPHGERILLTVTRLYPYKGVDRMLESLPQISRAVPGVKYLVVGVGPDQPRLEALTARLGLQSQVSFLGRLALSEIVELYSLADLFVMLSRDEPPDVEGFGLVFLEAAACGLPSVGGRSGGIPDAIDEGQSGWLVDPCDTQEITATIIELLKSPERLQRASEFCLSTAPHKTWERAADRILEEMFDGRT
jgi:phosphatidylinositol alpha-1,6-mannosyltransferase